MELRKGLSREDVGKVMRWTNSRGADFLMQWAGPKLFFPLTGPQLDPISDSLFSFYRDGTFVGMIQVLRREGGNAHIGRFLLDPDQTGRGMGTEALQLFCRTLFEDRGLTSVTLNVFKFNAQALNCYRKCGFEITEETLDEAASKTVVRMRLDGRRDEHDGFQS